MRYQPIIFITWNDIIATMIHNNLVISFYNGYTTITCCC